MKNIVTITYKDGTTETVKPKYMSIEGRYIEIKLLEKLLRKESPRPVDAMYIPFKNIREILIK
jgi:hypothetical protein